MYKLVHLTNGSIYREKGGHPFWNSKEVGDTKLENTLRTE